MPYNVCGKHAVVFAAKTMRRKPLSRTHFRRLEPRDQVAAKTMERPQLILKLRFNRAYQQRERRGYAC